MHPLIALVTAASLIFYFATLFAVGAARGKHKVAAPTMNGPPAFERAVRVQANTVEGLVLFLPSLWLFAAYWDVRLAAGLGVAWILGRILYMVGYLTDAAKRGPGFLIQMLATMVLLIGGAAGAVLALVPA
jgi:uncharacterized MAPEG superfamily protein